VEEKQGFLTTSYRRKQMPIKRWSWLSFVITVLLLSASVAFAQGGFTVNGSTVTSGGGMLSSGNFSLTGNIGQLEATGLLSKGGYTLRGGILARTTKTGSQTVHLPIILK
jgi:hypothetical protein